MLWTQLGTCSLPPPKKEDPRYTFLHIMHMSIWHDFWHIILIVNLFTWCLCVCWRGFHQELQHSLQCLTEILGGRGEQEGSQRGSQTSRWTPAVASTPPYYWTDHFLFPAHCHGRWKGERRRCFSFSTLGGEWKQMILHLKLSFVLLPY